MFAKMILCSDHTPPPPLTIRIVHVGGDPGVVLRERLLNYSNIVLAVPIRLRNVVGYETHGAQPTYSSTVDFTYDLPHVIHRGLVQMAGDKVVP